MGNVQSKFLSHQTLYNVDLKQHKDGNCIRIWVSLHLEAYQGEEGEMKIEMTRILNEIFPMIRYNISDVQGSGKFHLCFTYHNGFSRAVDIDSRMLTAARIQQLMEEATPLRDLYGSFCFITIFYQAEPSQ